MKKRVVMPMPITPEDFGSKGVSPGSCGLYTAIGEVNLIASIRAAGELQSRGTYGAGVMIKGIYPENKNLYALHVMYLNRQIAAELEPLITEHKIGLRHIGEMEPLVKPKMYRKYSLPELRRYFVDNPTPDEMMCREHTDDPNTYVRRLVEEFNTCNRGRARIFSSGKNIGTFVSASDLNTTMEAYDLKQYADYNVGAVMIHMRWPTSIVNSGVWWGIHPIGFLNSNIIHNGDLSSSPSNAQGIEAAGIKSMVGTDSESILLELDNLFVKRNFAYQQIEWAMCQMFPQEEEQLSEDTRMKYQKIVKLNPTLARYKMSGPSSFVAIIRKGGMAHVISGRDRDGLRQLWMGRSSDGKSVIWSSEEKCIYQTAFLTGKEYKAINCEPGKITVFELKENGEIKGAFGDTLEELELKNHSVV
ncbi:MAG: glutamine amidotransferase [bacterium]|nr:MAG: glutamine amidotransferase [bacterium]